jgi:hypothetical protein
MDSNRRHIPGVVACLNPDGVRFDGIVACLDSFVATLEGNVANPDGFVVTFQRSGDKWMDLSYVSSEIA